MTQARTRQRGRNANFAGQAAEARIAADFERRGHRVLARRWRGQGGEIDLIVSEPGGVVFVEVKQARTFEAAAESLQPRQMARICAAASEFLGDFETGQDTETRFDVALVDGQGQFRMIENAFGAV